MVEEHFLIGKEDDQGVVFAGVERFGTIKPIKNRNERLKFQYVLLEYGLFIFDAVRGAL